MLVSGAALLIPGYAAIPGPPWSWDPVALGVSGVIWGLLAMFFGYAILVVPSSHRLWGKFLIVLAFFSWTGYAGFVIGFFLLLIGGLLALPGRTSVNRPAAPPSPIYPTYPSASRNPPPYPNRCARCGMPLATGAMFCARCGARLGPDSSPPWPSPPPPPRQSTPPPRDSPRPPGQSVPPSGDTNQKPPHTEREQASKSTPIADERRRHLGFMGLPMNATQQQIRERYRDLAKIYHPDHWRARPKASLDMMKKLNEARDFLER